MICVQHRREPVVGRGCLLTWESGFLIAFPGAPARRFSSAAQSQRWPRSASPKQTSSPLSSPSPGGCRLLPSVVCTCVSSLKVTCRPLEPLDSQVQKVRSTWKFICSPLSYLGWGRQSGWVEALSEITPLLNSSLYFFAFPTHLLGFPSNLLNKSLALKHLSQGLIWGIQLEIIFSLETLQKNVFPRKGKLPATQTLFCPFRGSCLLLGQGWVLRVSCHCLRWQS